MAVIFLYHAILRVRVGPKARMLCVLPLWKEDPVSGLSIRHYYCHDFCYCLVPLKVSPPCSKFIIYFRFVNAVHVTFLQ